MTTLKITFCIQRDGLVKKPKSLLQIVTSFHQTNQVRRGQVAKIATLDPVLQLQLRRKTCFCRRDDDKLTTTLIEERVDAIMVER